MLCSPLILLFPSIDLRFFTANAFFNILSTPTKSTSTLFASFIWRLASRSTACCVLSSATLLQGKLRHATCAKIPTERFWKLTNVAIELLAQQPPPDSALASSKIQHTRICFFVQKINNRTLWSQDPSKLCFVSSAQRPKLSNQKTRPPVAGSQLSVTNSTIQRWKGNEDTLWVPDKRVVPQTDKLLLR